MSTSSQPVGERAWLQSDLLVLKAKDFEASLSDLSALQSDLLVLKGGALIVMKLVDA